MWASVRILRLEYPVFPYAEQGEFPQTGSVHLTICIDQHQILGNRFEATRERETLRAGL